MTELFLFLTFLAAGCALCAVGCLLEPLAIKFVERLENSE